MVVTYLIPYHVDNENELTEKRNVKKKKTTRWLHVGSLQVFLTLKYISESAAWSAPV